MKSIKRLMAALICLILLGTASTNSFPAALAQEDIQAQEALSMLQECMDMMPQVVMAVAYLGYREADDQTPLEDWLWQHAPAMLMEMPFIQTIPGERILGAGYGDLFCFVPRDDSTSLAVNHVVWQSDGAGNRPNVDTLLYYDGNTQPVLVFVGYEEYRTEPDIGIIAVAGNGAGLAWYPVVDEEYGYIVLPTGAYETPLLLDFSIFGGEDGTEGGMAWGWDAPGDMSWCPPTDEGLSDSEWACGEGWRMELERGGGDAGYAGAVRLYYQQQAGQPYDLMYAGSWRMENDCLRLELKGERGRDDLSGSFPLLIDPSGDNLYIQMSQDGVTCPPFFDEDMGAMELSRIYG